MEIPLDLVRTLAAVVTAGSLDAAASALQVTPSAVSQRLKALETRVGRVLLVRSRPVQPTAAGAALVRLARQVATLEQDTLASLGADPGGPVEVPLAVNADSMATWLLPALAPLASDVAFDLHRDDQEFTAALLEAGTVSAAVTAQATPVAGCSVRPLGSMRYVAVASPAHAERWFPDGVTAETLARAPLVDFDRRDDLQNRYLAANGVDAVSCPRHRVPASHDFARAIRWGFGWGLLPEQQLAEDVADGRLIRLGGPPVDVRLFWQRWKLASPVLDRIEAAVLGAARASLRR